MPVLPRGKFKLITRQMVSRCFRATLLNTPLFCIIIVTIKDNDYFHMRMKKTPKTTGNPVDGQFKLTHYYYYYLSIEYLYNI